jgi:tripartite ATP-independent transporter DctM subunit
MSENLPLILLGLGFFIPMFLNVPISFALGLATLACLVATYAGAEGAALGEAIRQSLEIVSTGMADGMNKFSLLAIPFFILSGYLMERGGSAQILIDLANVLVGRLPGGLAFVNIVACVFFGAASGSATATAASVGSVMVPKMKEANYDSEFSAAVTLTASTTGLLIPPSNVMLVYAIPASVSVAALFLAGFLPGLIMAGALMIVAAVIARKRNYPRAEKVATREALRRFVRALPELILLIVIMGGIMSGDFTATEASVIAVLYSIFVSLFIYKELKLRDMPPIFLKSAVTTAFIMFLIGVSSAMGFVFSYLDVPQKAATFLMGITENPSLMLLMINAILLVVGCFMDMTPAVLIFTPIFLPIVLKMGLDPVQFGIIMIVNLCVGLCTPPVGTLLFVGCAVGETTIGKMLRPMTPFLIALFVSLLVITFLPKEVILWAPSYFLKDFAVR